MFALSGSIELSEHRHAIEQFGPGKVLVATRILVEALDGPPAPKKSGGRHPVTLVTRFNDSLEPAALGRTVALVGEPPLPDDRRLLAILGRLRHEAAFEAARVEDEAIGSP